MILFIGLPIISTGIQSFYAQHDQVVKEVKKCDPFGCTVSIVVDQEKTSKIREEKPLGKFNGFGTYVDRNHLAIEEIGKFWNETNSFWGICRSSYQPTLLQGSNFYFNLLFVCNA